MREQNVQSVQAIYTAFAKGDVPAILERVTEDSEWSFNVGHSDVPWHPTFRGKANLPQFFGAFGGNIELEVFEPREFIDSGSNA